MDVDERLWLLARGQGPVHAVDNRRLEELFDEQVERAPRAEAVIGTEGTLTYQELRTRAWDIAARLSEHHARPGELIAIAMERGWEQVAAVLGICWSGAAYLPIDPHLPPDRIHQLLQQGRVRTVLTAEHSNTTPDIPPTLTTLTVGEPHNPTPPRPPRAGTHTDLAYVIFTSGSTGRPKGVMIDHRGAVNTCLDINRRFHIGPNDRALAVSSLSFDLSVYDIFGLLAAGGTIIMPPPTPLPDPETWTTWAHTHHATLWNSVPALAQLAAEHTHHPLTRIRLYLLSGDWIPLTLPDTLTNASPHTTLVSLGGATEASIWSIHHVIDQINPEWDSIPYGRPLTNQNFYILDDHGQLCPTGTPGELHIGGTGVALGYWDAPEQTRKSFTQNPYATGRLYHTGDRGKWHPDGHIQFLGRIDNQVKIRGYRIELGEIEHTLNHHPTIKDSTIIAADDAAGNKELVAFTVPSPGQRGYAAPSFSEFLRSRLPAYMVPTVWVELDQLPLTPNGKIDRKALAEQRDAVARRGGVDQPDVGFEADIAGIWREVLQVDYVDRDARILEIGGNSLLAARVTYLINERLGCEVPIQTVFTSSLSELAVAVEEISLEAVDEKLLDDIADMSAEEAATLLAEEEGNHD